VIEAQATEIATLRAENQRLRDENNRLKGEQGAPTILPSKRVAADHASERERGTGRPARPRVDTRPLLHIDRTEEREVDPALFPSDAERKGYAEFVVQDVALHTDTVLFRCARWYAASTRRARGGATKRRCRTTIGSRGSMGRGSQPWRCNSIIKDVLEELVARGLLDRRGLGLGAVYTLNTTA